MTLWTAARAPPQSRTQSDLQPVASNHASCREHESELRRALLEDVEGGFTLGPVTEAEAQSVCGTPRRTYGKLGAKGEMKIMKDGSRLRKCQAIVRRRWQDPGWFRYGH